MVGAIRIEDARCPLQARHTADELWRIRVAARRCRKVGVSVTDTGIQGRQSPTMPESRGVRQRRRVLPGSMSYLVNVS